MVSCSVTGQAVRGARLGGQTFGHSERELRIPGEPCPIVGTGRPSASVICLYEVDDNTPLPEPGPAESMQLARENATGFRRSTGLEIESAPKKGIRSCRRARAARR